MVVRFEAASVEHSDVVLAMMRALEDADPGPSPFEEERRRAIFAAFVGDPSLGQCWIIYKESQPVGYVVLTLGFSFEYGGRDSFIDEIYVHEKFRGQGIGRQTLEFVEARACEMGVKAVHLEVTRGNEAAIELYRRAQYAVHDRFLMTKRLSP